MKIDRINDIKVLRNELKKFCIKCIEGFTYDNGVIEVDEYYSFHQDFDGVMLMGTGDNDSCCLIDHAEFDNTYYKKFDLEKHTQSQNEKEV